MYEEIPKQELLKSERNPEQVIDVIVFESLILVFHYVFSEHRLEYFSKGFPQ